MRWWIWQCWQVLQPVVEHLVRRRVVLMPKWPFVHHYLEPYNGCLKRSFVEMYPWVCGPPKTLAQIMADSEKMPYIFWESAPQISRWRIDDHS